jgi:hypothetical protein
MTLGILLLKVLSFVQLKNLDTNFAANYRVFWLPSWISRRALYAHAFVAHRQNGELSTLPPSEDYYTQAKDSPPQSVLTPYVYEWLQATQTLDEQS